MRRRNKYLYQLLVTGSVLVIVPTIFFFTFFLNRSYEKIKESNKEYYDNLSGIFAETFADEIGDFKDQAVVFEINSRENDSAGGIFFEGTEKMSESPYYFWEACQSLIGYGKKSGLDDFGVYYYEQDWVLYNGQKCTSDRTIQSAVCADL